jgi:hypothetical protein
MRRHSLSSLVVFSFAAGFVSIVMCSEQACYAVYEIINPPDNEVYADGANIEGEGSCDEGEHTLLVKLKKGTTVVAEGDVQSGESAWDAEGIHTDGQNYAGANKYILYEVESAQLFVKDDNDITVQEGM